MEIFLATLFIICMVTSAVSISTGILRATFDSGNEEIYFAIGFISMIFSFTFGIIGAFLYG